MYNFMGIIFEAQVSFIFSLLCILFKNLFQILVILKNGMRNVLPFLIRDAIPALTASPIKDDPDLQ